MIHNEGCDVCMCSYEDSNMKRAAANVDTAASVVSRSEQAKAQRARFGVTGAQSFKLATLKSEDMRAAAGFVKQRW